MGERRAESGLAHVATVSFLAARAVPAGGFWVALAGGVALARAGERRGLRHGFGTSLAAMLQTVAILGPARVGVPLTQALTAPLIGHLKARQSRLGSQLLVCAGLRLVQNAVATAFFIWVVAGGLTSYAHAYATIVRHVPLLPGGTTGALVLTAASLVAWAAFASTVQVLLYLRGLRRWPATDAVTAARPAFATAVSTPRPPERFVFDPRAVAVAGAVAFGMLLAGSGWPLLGAVAAWLGVVSLAPGLDRSVVPGGLALAGLLAAGALVFGAVGGMGTALTLRRAVRAAMLVLVATWIRAAAGAPGLREVSRRALGRLHRVPSVPEAVSVLDDLGSGRDVGETGRSLVAVVRRTPRRPLALVDAVLDWVAGEAGTFRAAARSATRVLAVRGRDLALVALAAAPALALLPR